jgi:uncharacterized protein YggE
MKRVHFLPALVLSFSSLATAQAPPPPQNVQAVGTATVMGQPDQVKVDIGVTTSAATAQDASAQNATQMTAVQNQIRQVLGPNADIKTIGYSVTPDYRTPQGQAPVLVGFTATNTIEVTAADTASIVKVIDSVSQVGATNIQSLRFTIADDTPLRLQALTMASKQAIGHAQAIASGLGLKVGAVIAAQEGFSSTPIVGVLAPGAAPSTPIQPGLVSVSATVTISAQLTQ